MSSRPRRPVALEVAVTGVDGVRVAARGGADCVQLCSGTDFGASANLGASLGVTPSLGLVDAAVAVGLPVHVLVRPTRGGPGSAAEQFVFTATEVEVMVRDIEHLVDAGVAGVVIGALTTEGLVDRHAVKSLVRAAEELPVTFHRAIDLAADPVTALAQLRDLGIARVTSSGGAFRALDGVPSLRALAAAAGGSDGAERGVEVMAAGAVSPEDIPLLLEAGVSAVQVAAPEPLDVEFVQHAVAALR